MAVIEAIHQHVLKAPASAWTAAVEANGEIRNGAWVADSPATSGRLAGGPGVIVKKERPRPGTQLPLTDADGMRLTGFATNTSRRPITELELHHRLRARRAEDRIRAARATGLRNVVMGHEAVRRRPLPNC